MSEELRRFLVKAVVDDEFRELARREPERAFAGFALADDEKDALRGRGPEVLGLLGRALGVPAPGQPAPEPESAAAPGPPPPAPPIDATELARAARSSSGEERREKLLELIRAIEAGAPAPASTARGTVDVWIVGLGIVAADHLTRETERALVAAREVLFVDTGVATGPFLETFCPRVTSLFDESQAQDGGRLEAYHQVAVRVIEAALDGGPVAFAVQGHPLVGAYASPLIVALAAHLGLSARALPGISSLDALLADLGIDPLRTGLLIVEATDLLVRLRPITPEVPVLVLEVGTVETRLRSTRPSVPARFTRLRDHLSLFYPPEHPVTAYFASPHPLMEPWRETFPLASLPDHARVLHPGVTLVIPSSRDRPIQDADLVAKLDSEEHLRRITGGL
jgi:precorrin-3B methylase